MNSVLKIVKNSKPAVTHEVVKERAFSARNITMNWESSATERVIKALSAFTSGIGAPKEFLFFPLLSATAAMMRSHTRVRLNENWTEQPIVWTIVAAAKGEKKSPTFRILTAAVKEVEDRLQQEHMSHYQDDNGDNDGDIHMPKIQMTNSQLTFAHVLYEQLEHQSGGSQCDKKILLSLNGGDSWSRSTKSSGTETVERSHFNYTGFMQPAIAIAMLNQSDFDGFNDGHLAIVAPKHQKVYFQDLKCNANDKLNLADLLFGIRKAHEEEHEYSLTDAATTKFALFYDEMEDKMAEVDEDSRGILSKAQGQLARLSMILRVLYNAIDCMKEETVITIDSEINEKVIDMAIMVMRYCMAPKLALMGEFDPVGHTKNAEEHCSQSDFIKKNALAIKKISFNEQKSNNCKRNCTEKNFVQKQGTRYARWGC